MLARGELRAVGATTLDEYRKHIEKDAALERRFQPVLVGEPSVEDAIAILRGLKERYEVHHGVRIQDAALIAAATLSDRYIADRFLPDKAIDLIDEAASKLRIEIDSLPTEIDEVDRRILQLEIELHLAGQGDRRRVASSAARRSSASSPNCASSSSAMKAEWQAEKDAIHKVVGRQGAPRAGPPRARARRARGRPRARRAAAPRRDPRARAHSSPRPRTPPTRPPRRRASSRRRSTPRTSPRSSRAGPASRSAACMEGEVEKLVHMEERLHRRVVGQDEAVAVGLQRAAPLAAPACSDPDRPIGTFLFLGPTGVGKTELARALAEFMFDSQDAMVRIDMSEYMEKHAVAATGRRASRLRRLRRGRPADRGGAPPPVLRRAARRDREGPPRRLQRAAAGHGRRAPDRRPGPHGRLQERRADHDLEHPGRPGRGGGTFKPEFINRLDDIVEFQVARPRADRRDRRPPGRAPDRTRARARHRGRAHRRRPRRCWATSATTRPTARARSSA